MGSPPKKILFLFIFFFAFGMVGIFQAHAANITWTGGGGNSLWDNAANWSTATVPTSTDVAIFSASSSNAAAIDTNVNVLGIVVTSTYAGTITQDTGYSVTIGSSGYGQSGGTFIGSANASDTITVNGSFMQSGGTFTSTAGTLAVAGNLTLSAGTFNAHGGIVSFIGGTYSTINCSSSPSFSQVAFNKNNTAAADVTIQGGCTVPLGNNPTAGFGGSNDGNPILTNYGTITGSGNVAFNDAGYNYFRISDWISNYGTISITGNLTFDTNSNGNIYTNNYGTISVSGNISSPDAYNWGYNSSDFYNYGSMTVGGTSWVGSGIVNESATSSFSFGGTAMTVYNDFEVASGTATFGGSSAIASLTVAGGFYSTLGCTGTQIPSSTITKDASMSDGADVTILAGCTVPLGNNPTAVFGGSYDGNPILTNYGTITGSGTVSFNTSGANYWQFPDRMSNYGTITISGGLTSDTNGKGTFYISNYGTISVSGNLSSADQKNNGNYAWGSDIYNYATTTVSGTSWTGSGIVNEAATSSFSFGGTAMTVYADFEVASGTATFGGSSAIASLTVVGGSDSTLGCTGTQIPSSTINKDIGNGDGSVVVLAGCTVPLGNNATAVFGGSNDAPMLINYGTIMASGTVAFNSNGSNYWAYPTFTRNYGTIAINGNLTFDTNSQGVFFINNYGTISVSGNLSSADQTNNGNYTWGSDIYNYATTTVSGTSWVGSGIVNEAATSSFTFGGTAMTVYSDFEVASGTATFGGGQINLSFSSNNSQSAFIPGSITYSGLTIDKQGQTLTFLPNATSTLDIGNLSFLSGYTSFSTSTYTLFVRGDYLQNSANSFGGSTFTMDFSGTPSSSIVENAGSFIGNLAIDKSGMVAATLDTNFSVATGTCAINTGTFDIGGNNFTCGGALTVSSGGWLADYPGHISTITLGGNVTNNGVIFLDGSGPNCTSPYPQFVTVTSTASSVQPVWSGSGEFVVRSAIVSSQGGSSPLSIPVWNGTLANDTAIWSVPTGQGRIGYIQSTPVETGAGTALPFTYWPRPEDLIVVAVSGSSGETISAPTDSASNTYYLATTQGFNGGTVDIYYAAGATSTTPFAVTMHGSGSGYLSGAAYEFTDAALASSTLDSESTNYDNSGSAVSLTSNVATGHSTADELFFGITTVSAGNDALTSGSGWTSLANAITLGSQQGLSTEFQSLGAPASLAATWTAATSTSYAAAVAIFDPPGMNAVGYAPSGTLDSVVFDTKSVNGAQLNSLTWYGSALNYTNVGFQFAVSNSPSGPWTFEGPSGNGSTYFGYGSLPGTIIPLVSSAGGAGYAMFNGYRYFRYRVILFSDSSGKYTPTVTGVDVNWSP